MDIITFLAQSGLISLFVTGLAFYYKEFYKKPELYYDLWAPYIIDDEKIVPIIIGNSGHAKATNVRLTINCDGKILNISEEIPENYSKTDEKQNIIIYEFKRLANSLEFPIYFKLSNKSTKFKINITSDEGIGNRKKSESYYSTSELILMIILSFIIGISIILAINP